jgi:hypothetical protein
MALDCGATASWLGSTTCSADEGAAPKLNVSNCARRQAIEDQSTPLPRLARSFCLDYIAGARPRSRVRKKPAGFSGGAVKSLQAFRAAL